MTAAPKSTVGAHPSETHTCERYTCSCGCEEGSLVTSKRGTKMLSSIWEGGRRGGRALQGECFEDGGWRPPWWGRGGLWWCTCISDRAARAEGQEVPPARSMVKEPWLAVAVQAGVGVGRWQQQREPHLLEVLDHACVFVHVVQAGDLLVAVCMCVCVCVCVCGVSWSGHHPAVPSFYRKLGTAG